MYTLDIHVHVFSIDIAQVVFSIDIVQVVLSIDIVEYSNMCTHWIYNIRCICTYCCNTCSII